MKSNPIEYLNELIWSEPLEKQRRIGRIVTSVMRYLFAVLRDVFSGQITMRAMSLVYTTLLSIVPLLAFSFSVLKASESMSKSRTRCTCSSSRSATAASRSPTR